MSEIKKRFLVILNRYQKTNTFRIRTDLFVLTAPEPPGVKTLKSVFSDAVRRAVRDDPGEMRRLREDPGYQVTWSDVRKLPVKSLAACGLRTYDQKDPQSFCGVSVVNVPDDGEFDLAGLS